MAATRLDWAGTVPRLVDTREPQYLVPEHAHVTATTGRCHAEDWSPKAIRSPVLSRSRGLASVRSGPLNAYEGFRTCGTTASSELVGKGTVPHPPGESCYTSSVPEAQFSMHHAANWQLSRTPQRSPLEAPDGSAKYPLAADRIQEAPLFMMMTRPEGPVFSAQQVTPKPRTPPTPSRSCHPPWPATAPAPTTVLLAGPNTVASAPLQAQGRRFVPSRSHPAGSDSAKERTTTARLLRTTREAEAPLLRIARPQAIATPSESSVGPPTPTTCSTVAATAGGPAAKAPPVRPTSSSVAAGLSRKLPSPRQRSPAPLEDVGGGKLAANVKVEVQQGLEPMRQEILSLCRDMSKRTESIEERVELVERSLLDSFKALEDRLATLVEAGDDGNVMKQEAARMGGSTASKEVADADNEATVVEVVVQKTGPDEWLGMDVSHVHGHLAVMQVFQDGAIDRTKQALLQQVPAGDTLEVGDIIIQVNDVMEPDTAMVEECRSRTTLRIRALRF